MLFTFSLLSSCGREAEVKTSTGGQGGAPAPAQEEPVPIEVPFQERLNALETHPEKCAAPQAKALEKIDSELRALYLKELAATKTLPEAQNVDASLSPYFARVRTVAEACQGTRLARTSPEETVVASYLKEATCENLVADDALLAYKLFQGSLGQESTQALGKLLASCGRTDTAANEKSFRASRLGGLELKRQGATKNPCSLDSLYFADESSAQIAEEYQAVARPLPAARILSLQLHLRSGLSFRKLRSSCEEKNQVEPVLALQGLEAELSAFEVKQDRCGADDTLTGIKARAIEAESADQAKLLSRKFRDIVKGRYQALLAKAQLLETACQEQKEGNLRNAQYYGLKARWEAFRAQDGYSEARLGEAATLLAELQKAKSADNALTLSPAGRAELKKLYRELEGSIAKWQEACRASLAAEKERQRLEEEKKKQEEERKRLEEEKRKREEERKRLEEEKKKQEEERKRLEEEKRKEAERKRAEEEKRRKEEAEKKRLEEEKKKTEEQRRQEEEKRKREEERKRAEEEKRRKEEERKRAELEKYRSVEEKRQKLTPPKWEQMKNPNHKAWTNTVLSVIRKRMSDFDQARDAESFCPGYHKAELHERENCWLQLVSFIALKESNYKQVSSFVESNGVASIGFLALSVGECDAFGARTARDLNDPVKNLTCGTNKMAALIARDKMISDTDIGPDLVQRRNGRGAAAYWSTLKPKHKVYHKINKRWYTVGFKPLFQEWLKDYKKPRK